MRASAPSTAPAPAMITQPMSPKASLRFISRDFRFLFTARRRRRRERQLESFPRRLDIHGIALIGGEQPRVRDHARHFFVIVRRVVVEKKQVLYPRFHS